MNMLTQRLDEENRTLLKILDVKDALSAKKYPVQRQGWLLKKGQRNLTWKKRFFVLRSESLSYYKSDQPDAEEKGMR